MKSFNKLTAAVIVIFALIITAANLFLINYETESGGRPYRVEIGRIARQIESGGLSSVDFSALEYVTDIEMYDGSDDFFTSDSDYCIEKIGGELYRFDYRAGAKTVGGELILAVNIILALALLATVSLLIFVRRKILLPFERLSGVPYELAKGNLTAPLKESKSRFFGKFTWGVDLLREKMEQQKQRELDLQKDRKTLLLSLSHDIKTPLSAIKLYAKALSKGLYTDREKQLETAENINAKADEIEGYVSQIIAASREDFLNLEVNMSELYLSQLIARISGYYGEKLALVGTDFTIGDYSDCLIKGDIDRCEEVLQNIIENAIKYGDGKEISLGFSEEDGCILITVKNSGCALPDAELPHIFESFWRGSNSQRQKGSGLGLYICRALMHEMGGEIFARKSDGCMYVTAVFGKV